MTKGFSNLNLDRHQIFQKEDRQKPRMTDRRSQRQTDTDTLTEIINREQKEYTMMTQMVDIYLLKFLPSSYISTFCVIIV